MFILFFLVTAFKASLGTPVPAQDLSLGPLLDPFTVWGHNLPGCINPAAYRTLPEIVWSCLMTIFASTWTVLHPNVPHPRHTQCQRFWRRVLMMAQVFICPEFTLVFALRQVRGARRHRDEYNEKFETGAIPDYPSLLFKLICMTPLRKSMSPELQRIHELNRAEKSKDKPEYNTILDTRNKIPWTLTHGFLLEMGGLVFVDKNQELHVITEVNQLREPFNIPESQIVDKSKSDGFVRIIAVAQLLWFCIQCVARWRAQLPVTELEIVTFALAYLVGAVLRSTWRYKPQNMDAPICLPDRSYLDDKSPPPIIIATPSLLDFRKYSFKDLVLLPAGLGYPLFRSPLQPYEDIYYSSSTPFSSAPFLPVRGRAATPELVQAWETSLILYLIGPFFGGLHLIPLYLSTFPSSLERSSWKVAAIAITAEPIFLIVCIPLLAGMPREQLRRFTPSNCIHHAMATLIGLAGACCVIARLTILVIAFTTLRSLPQEAYYNIQWTVVLPHF